MTKLLVNTGAYEDLTGTFDSKGVRQKGYLHDFLSSDELTAVVVAAARAAHNDGRADEAIELFRRAADYDSAFSILNNQLSQLLDVNQSSEQRELRHKWKNLAVRLYHEMNATVGSTLEQLLHLMNFFDKAETLPNEALAILDQVKIGENRMVPLREENINGSFMCYKNMDECIRRQYHLVLLSAMKCLYSLYKAEKGAAGVKKPLGFPLENNNSKAGNEARIKELSSMAQRLVTFAGLIKMPREGAELMRYENLMR